MDRLLTADELAERLGMKTDWVWAQARAGRIPHVQLGRYRRFRESAIEAWLHDLATSPPSSGGSFELEGPRRLASRSRPIGVATHTATTIQTSRGSEITPSISARTTEVSRPVDVRRLN